MHATNRMDGTTWGLFLDSASTLFFRGERSGSEELPEDNSSSVVASLSPVGVLMMRVELEFS